MQDGGMMGWSGPEEAIVRSRLSLLYKTIQRSLLLTSSFAAAPPCCAAMARLTLLPAVVASFLMSALVAAAAAPSPPPKVLRRSFYVGNFTVNRLCTAQVITAANNSIPGPTILAREGDALVVTVYNQSPYNVTIHWHGVRQLFTAWADGPVYITQCPIPPGGNYTHRFNVTGQEGTLWWHAHSRWLRATVHGAIIIRPREGNRYPFRRPYREVPIILGEWWNANIIDVENQAMANGGGSNASDAFTINSLPGDLYPCSQNQTYRLTVVAGRTYLLRIINAALNNHLFFKIANHNLTVVGVDASYTVQQTTDVVAITPGQTTDVLLTANQPAASYYMSAGPYVSSAAIDVGNLSARAVLDYGNASSSTPILSTLPATNDTATAHAFYTGLRGLVSSPWWGYVPTTVDHSMFVTVSLNVMPCAANATCGAPYNTRFAASMNNYSFQTPTTRSMLEAEFYGIPGVFDTSFPDNPPLRFNYTDPTLSDVNASMPLILTNKRTSAKEVGFNQTVQMVLQNTAFFAVENHPMHLHGYDFYVLAQGFGNYDPSSGPGMFNLVDPQKRNTIGVPVGGWAVIRFVADNPGVWFMHCHLDAHVPWGLATTFLVKNGPTNATSLPPPPPDLPTC